MTRSGVEGRSGDLNERLRALSPRRRAAFEALLAERGISLDLDTGPGRVEGEPTALTVKQEALWHLHRNGERDAFYHVGLLLELGPDGDAARLEEALEAGLEHHASLRTAYPPGPDGQPRAVLSHPPVLERHRLSVGSHADAVERATELALQAAVRPHSLDVAPVRCLLVDARPHAIFAAITTHDIASDSYSLRSVLVPELERRYQGVPSPEPGSPPLRLGDVAHWQRQSLERGEVAGQVERWVARLRGCRPLASPDAGNRTGARLPLSIPPSVAGRAAELAQRLGTSLSVVVLAAWSGVLGTATGRTDVPIGSCTSGRHRPELEPVLGNLTNTLVLWGDTSSAASVTDLAVSLREHMIAALADADAPFETVMGRLLGIPLVQDEAIGVRFTFHHHHDAHLVAPRSDAPLLAVHDLHLGFAKAALSLEVTAAPAGLDAYLEYRPAAFDHATARRLVAAVEHALRHPDAPLPR